MVRECSQRLCEWAKPLISRKTVAFSLAEDYDFLPSLLAGSGIASDNSSCNDKHVKRSTSPSEIHEMGDFQCRESVSASSCRFKTCSWLATRKLIGFSF